MIKVNHFTHKHPEASTDYKLAYDITNALLVGQSQSANADNIKVFRKYIYDLGLKQGKDFATRKRDNNILQITRLS